MPFGGKTWLIGRVELVLFATAALLEILGDIFYSDILHVAAVLVFLIVSLVLPIRLLSRPAKEWHALHPYILGLAAVTALLSPSHIYREGELLVYSTGAVVADTWNCMYFCAVTWTTLGYGDIYPVGAGKVLASVHSLTGYTYMALLIVFLARHLDPAHHKEE